MKSSNLSKVNICPNLSHFLFIMIFSLIHRIPDELELSCDRDYLCLFAQPAACGETSGPHQKVPDPERPDLLRAQQVSQIGEGDNPPEEQILCYKPPIHQSVMEGVWDPPPPPPITSPLKRLDQPHSSTRQCWDLFGNRVETYDKRTGHQLNMEYMLEHRLHRQGLDSLDSMLDYSGLS